VYTLYILRCKNNTLYTGITNDLEHRLEMHRSGKGSKYVRAHLPFKLVYRQKLRTKSNALKREAFIKKMDKEEKLELIAAD
jgi:putative endonuclease